MKDSRYAEEPKLYRYTYIYIYIPPLFVFFSKSCQRYIKKALHVKNIIYFTFGKNDLCKLMKFFPAYLFGSYKSL